MRAGYCYGRTPPQTVIETAPLSYEKQLIDDGHQLSAEAIV